MWHQERGVCWIYLGGVRALVITVAGLGQECVVAVLQCRGSL